MIAAMSVPRLGTYVPYKRVPLPGTFFGRSPAPGFTWSLYKPRCRLRVPSVLVGFLVGPSFLAGPPFFAPRPRGALRCRPYAPSRSLLALRVQLLLCLLRCCWLFQFPPGLAVTWSKQFRFSLFVTTRIRTPIFFILLISFDARSCQCYLEGYTPMASP